LANADGNNCAKLSIFPSVPKTCKLKWTGSIVEWVELIYALYSVKRINNGKITLKELFGQMGEIFDIDVKEFAVYFVSSPVFSTYRN
jgi:hypothetical protein